MQKHCAKCGLPFECAASEDCWCKSVAAWEGVLRMVRENYPDCLCKTCFSFAFYHPATLKSAWGIGVAVATYDKIKEQVVAKQK